MSVFLLSGIEIINFVASSATLKNYRRKRQVGDGGVEEERSESPRNWDNLNIYSLI